MKKDPDGDFAPMFSMVVGLAGVGLIATGFVVFVAGGLFGAPMGFLKMVIGAWFVHAARQALTNRVDDEGP